MIHKAEGSGDGQMVKILVADSTAVFCAAAAEALEDKYLVITCCDGRSALQAVSSEHPDVIWLDLMLPGMDGLAILRAIRLAGLSPKIVACVRHVSDHILETLSGYKLFWLMQKPCDLHAAMLHIETAAAAAAAEKSENMHSAERMIRETLQLLGLVGKRSGHKSLYCALQLMIADPQAQVTKTLYPNVAELCDGTAQSVERGIRCVISVAWDKRDPLLWNLYFPEFFDRCPSNGVFLERIAERIRIALDMDREDNEKK